LPTLFFPIFVLVIAGGSKMKINRYPIIILTLVLLSMTVNSQEWLTDLEEGFEEASESDRSVLLVFSGYDWCAPCIRLKSQVFDSKVFLDFAARDLVLVNIDFPRKKKNMPGPEREEKNRKVAESYNPEGAFPRVLLFSSDGEENLVVDHGSLEPDIFLQEIKRKRNELGL
jgi:thioredoxin-related protein